MLSPHTAPIRKLSGGLVAVSLLTCLGSLPAAYAQAKAQFNVPNIEAPGNRESAAQRGGAVACVSGDTPLMAIVPETNIGLTTAAYPNFYVYVPPTQAKTARFVLFNEATNALVYEGDFAVNSAQGGIVTVSLPHNGIQQSLEVDQAYYWYFSLECDADNPDANPVVQSNIKRVDPDTELARSLDVARPETLPALYAAAGIWYDALAASAHLSSSTSHLERRPAADWSELLQSVGLNKLSNSPLLSQH